jgi:hypothetical protein
MIGSSLVLLPRKALDQSSIYRDRAGIAINCAKTIVPEPKLLTAFVTSALLRGFHTCQKRGGSSLGTAAVDRWGAMASRIVHRGLTEPLNAFGHRASLRVTSESARAAGAHDRVRHSGRQRDWRRAAHGGTTTLHPVFEQLHVAPAGHLIVQPPPAQLPIVQVS